MITVSDWIKRLKYLAFNRVTYYDNSFPANCGEINADGSVSFDCINLVKSVINDPDIAYKTKPAGYHVKPGTVIPDVDGMGILGLCKGVRWWDFSTIVPGEFLYMTTDGHGGVYVGEFTANGKTYNTIECTAAFGAGVRPSYMNLKTGARYDCKGGFQVYAWEAHGKLSKYINYKKKEEKSMFKDVPTTDKNYKYYKWAVNNGIMKKDKDGNFNPDKTMKRKHIAVILYRFYKLLKK